MIFIMEVLYENYKILKISELRNKLFCTFSHPEKIEYTLSLIQNNYNILYKKIFILEADNTSELICTYNPDYHNMNEMKIIPNTILLHRKKETNTLYSINSLNILLAELNKNNEKNQIDWNNYKNCMLITRQGILTQLNTKIFDIINLN